MVAHESFNWNTWFDRGSIVGVEHEVLHKVKVDQPGYSGSAWMKLDFESRKDENNRIWPDNWETFPMFHFVQMP